MGYSTQPLCAQGDKGLDTNDQAGIRAACDKEGEAFASQSFYAPGDRRLRSMC